MQECQVCASAYRNQIAMHSAFKDSSLYHSAPEGLEKRIRLSLRREAKPEVGGLLKPETQRSFVTGVKADAMDGLAEFDVDAFFVDFYNQPVQATANGTDRCRRALHGFYTRYDKPQQQYQKALLRPQTVAALTPIQRRVLAIDDAENDRLSSQTTRMSGFLK